MFNDFSFFTKFIPALSLTTIIGLIILAIVAPSVLKMIASTWEAFMNMFKPIFTALGDGAVAFVKSFIEGTKVILSNLSTLAVILVVIVSSGWYFRTWNDDRVIKPYQTQITQLKKDLQACKAVKVPTQKRAR